MLNGTSYSLADIAAATGGSRNNDGWGGDGCWWLILLFLFGWGNGGWGGQGNGGATRDALTYSFDFNGLENGVRGIQQGLCDGFYAMNTGMLNGFSGVQNTLCQGFSGVNSGISTSTAQLQQAINNDTVAGMQNTYGLTTAINGVQTALNQCCCDTKGLIAQNFADLNYNLASQACDTRRAIADSTRDIIDSNNAGVRSILDFLTQDKIAALTAENQSLKFAASQANQNAFITANQNAQTAEIIRRLETPCPIPAYVVPNPNCCYNNGNCC